MDPVKDVRNDLLTSQSAVPDLPDGFAADLASAQTSSALRERIATSFQRWTQADGVLFFERTTDGHYACTLAVGVAPAHLDGRGALARWLRVNGEVLVSRARPEVMAYLSSEDRSLLLERRADASVPFVTGGQLVAVLLLCCVADDVDLSKLAHHIELAAHRAAELWAQVTHTEQVRAHHAAMGHSQRLGIAGQVASSVAHEVRSPLAAIRSLVQFVKETPVSAEESDSILADVLAEVDRINQTVTEMLQLSQPPVSRDGVLNLLDVVQSVFRFVRAYAGKHGVAVSVKSEGHAIHIRGDEREVRQLLTNLLLNACQACDSGGHVVLTVRPVPSFEPSMVEVAITDTGIGIPPEHLPRIFEAFFTTKPQGTGLGLPHCREVTERHGGVITVESSVGQGTCVRVNLPLLEIDEFSPRS